MLYTRKRAKYECDCGKPVLYALKSVLNGCMLFIHEEMFVKSKYGGGEKVKLFCVKEM